MKKLQRHTLYKIENFKEINSIYEDCYKELYYYIDNQDAWLYRVMEWKYDDEKEWEYTLERNNLDLINNTVYLKEAIENDDLSNWDYEVYETIDALMSDLIQSSPVNEITL